jgi:hypothetical protein
MPSLNTNGKWPGTESMESLLEDIDDGIPDLTDAPLIDFDRGNDFDGDGDNKFGSV